MKRKLLIRDVQLIELEMLNDFVRVCEDNGLRYMLACGTLLGSIKYKGFVPWDDDIDVFMPRPDFDRLCELAKDKELFNDNYSFICERNGTFDRPFAKIQDIRTYIVRKFSHDQFHIFVDIVPVDGISDQINLGKSRKRIINVIKLLAIRKSKLGKGTNFIRKVVKYPAKAVLNLFNESLFLGIINKELSKYDYDSAKYVGAVASIGFKGWPECMLKNEFEQTVSVLFEGEEYSTMSCWDGYLHGKFGKYEEPPAVGQRPEDKSHFIEAWMDE